MERGKKPLKSVPPAFTYTLDIVHNTLKSTFSDRGRKVIVSSNLFSFEIQPTLEVVQANNNNNNILPFLFL